MARVASNRGSIASQEELSEYEKLRMARIAENKARMAALGIIDHVRTMTEFFQSAKKRAPRLPRCKTEMVEVRRSDRIKGVGAVAEMDFGSLLPKLEQCEADLASLEQRTRPERLLRRHNISVVKTIKKRHGKWAVKQSWGFDGGNKEGLSHVKVEIDDDLFVELEPAAESKVRRPGNQPLPSKIPLNLSLTPFLREHRCDSKGRGSIYDPIVGICCHFCRQKKLCGESDCERCGFMDVNKACKGKSDCSRCHSSTGVFCRACLKVRYGQEMEDVFNNAKWLCPHCVMEDGTDPFWLCNSSICLKKWGLPPTGIAIHTAKQEGYQSVAHYLKAKLEREGKRPQI